MSSVLFCRNLSLTVNLHQPMASPRSSTADDGQRSSRRHLKTRLHYPHPTWTFTSYLLTFTISILTCCVPTLSEAPALCSRPPPPLDCGGVYRGDGFYYNASSPTPCLRWPDWSCRENSLFSTIEECMSTCDTGETAKINRQYCWLCSLYTVLHTLFLHTALFKSNLACEKVHIYVKHGTHNCKVLFALYIQF